MRRNSCDDDRRRLEAAAALLNSKNVGDLIYRYETKNDANIREMLSSPQLQHQLDMFYCKNPAPSDMRFTDLARIRYFQQQQQQQNYNDSLISLTDSEFCSDDQQQDTPYERLTNEKVVHNLTRFGKFIEMIARLPWPRMSVTGMGICFLVAVFICPRACDENLLFPAFRLLFGTLYPAYASYKAVRTKNVKEYVKWMMYWIVYAFFTCIETFTDIFLAWFPFYYEVKVIIVIWLLSPATKGSSTLYRKFVHPMLTRREQEIDEYINQAKEKGYTAVLQLGSKGVNYATNVIMQTALKGGGNLVQTIRRSYSLSDLSEPDIHRTNDEIDDVARPQRLLRPRSQTARSASGGRNVEMYFPEVDVAQKAPTPNYNYIRSSEDISSGYSSAEPISTGLSRTASMTNTTRPRFKAKRAEEDIYLESDEYEAMPEVRHPNNYSPYAYYPIKPIPSSSKSQRYNTNEIEDWKNQAYLDNQKYFQESVLYSLRNAKPQDVGKVDVTNTPILEQSESIETPEEHSSKPDIKMDDDSKEVKVPPAKIAEEMVDKYELFCKWLENNEKLRNERKSNNETPTPVASSTLLPQSEDEFRDTMSTGSGDELFHDTQNLDSQPQQQPALPSSLLDIVRSEKLQVLSASNISESIDSVEGDSLPSILDDFNVSRKSSTSDLKRPAVHNKGKAPEPPATTSSPPSPSPEQDTTTSIALNLPETITSLNTNDQAISIDDRNSRSPSPRSDSKKSTKKNLFKNYLPSLFRSESPKPNSSTDEHLKETQI